MDISKIISNSIEETIKGFGKKDNPKFPLSDDEAFNNSIEQYEILLTYSQNLLVTYHEALKTALAEQGINI